MLSPDKARQDFQAALAALRQAGLTPGLGPVERAAVREAIRALTDDYLDAIELEVHALGAQYQGFLDAMGQVVATLQGGKTPASVLARLSELVDAGAGLLAPLTGAPAAQPAPAAPPGAKAKAPAARARGKTRAAAGEGGEPLRILCVHGVGHQEGDPGFEGAWRSAMGKGLAHWSLARPFELEFVAYDELFAADPPSALDYVTAVAKLSASGIVHGLGDLFRRRRGLGDIKESVRWTAGMVVQWAEDSGLRAAARNRVLEHVRRFTPHAVFAHSLGSLITYDALARHEGSDALADGVLVTLGSQIGNPFVRATLGGRVQPVNARRWYHLYNPEDDAFAAELRLADERFEQVDAAFDIKGFLDHDAQEYLLHPNTVDVVWRALSTPGAARALGGADASRALAESVMRTRRTRVAKPRRRALLVGINDYPSAADKLDGCVNDVFLMSSLLQESGFAPDDVRIVLDQRATAAGILERLDWLLDGAEDGQERVFYYSGHGAQIPGYGQGEKVDRKDECLVAWDFDWSREHAVTDDQFFELYSQLPYGTQFLTIFDCCHSGGLTRDGSARVRGLAPPDDIRHRELEWSPAEEMWIARGSRAGKAAKALQAERAGAGRDEVVQARQQARFGRQGDVRRLGVGAELRCERTAFDQACADYGHRGPFMPILLQACGETQYSYEYRHGVQSHGAFTYSLGLVLREARRRKKPLTWEELVQQVGQKLERLEYDQKPVLVCPTALRKEPIPWERR